MKVRGEKQNVGVLQLVLQVKATRVLRLTSLHWQKFGGL